MNDDISDILKNQFLKLLPFLSSICFILIFYIPLRLPLLSYIRPDIGIVCVFFWSLYRQDLFNVFAAFLLGLIADGLSGVPLGLNTFVYLFIFVINSTFGRFINMRSFIINWIGFLTVFALALMVKVFLTLMYYERFSSLSSVFSGYLATVLLYPLFARFNMFLQNRFLGPEGVIYE